MECQTLVQYQSSHYPIANPMPLTLALDGLEAFCKRIADERIAEQEKIALAKQKCLNNLGKRAYAKNKKNQEELLKAMPMGKSIQVSELGRIMGIDRSSVYSRLVKAEEAGFVVRTGKGGLTRWALR